MSGQRQDSLVDQMQTVRALATEAGCCDAADFIRDYFGTGHSAYADPIAGGWEGYEGACHDCTWRSGQLQPPGRVGKAEAQKHARAHEAEMAARLTARGFGSSIERETR